MKIHIYYKTNVCFYGWVFSFNNTMYKLSIILFNKNKTNDPGPYIRSR